jgi:hypothetical protein
MQEILPMQAEQSVTKWLLAVNRVGLAFPRWALLNRVKGLMFRTVFFRSSAHRTFDGINLYWGDYSRLRFRKPGNGEEEAFFATVTKALTMLQACDPRRYKRAGLLASAISTEMAGPTFFGKPRGPERISFP